MTSDSDERTLDLGGRVTSGDECYPQKITLGDFLRIIEDEGRDNVAFLMPPANGPCRFGQYLHLIRAKFDELGYGDVPVISITSSDGYSSIGAYSQNLIRTAWRAVLAEDILMKLLLKTRPYEREKGTADAAYQHEPRGGRRGDLAGRHLAQGALAGLVPAMVRARDRFRAVPADYDASAAAHRRRRRDLLPPEHLLQLRPHPRRRGAGRRVLAVGHRRVGVVHGRRASPPAHRRAQDHQQGQRHPLHQEQDHAQRRTRHATGRSTTTSSATKSRRTCARCSR